MNKFIRFIKNIKYKKAYNKTKQLGYIYYYEDYMSLVFSFMINQEIEKKLWNGKTGIFKIIDLRDNLDGWGSHNVKLGLINYKNEKQFKDMSFEEFLNSGIIYKLNN